MYYRRALILAEESAATAGTKTIDITVSDVISRIEISFRATKAIEGMTAAGYAAVSKIELVDGSEVLHSMNGGENQALAIYSRKCPTMSHGQHTLGNSEYQTFAIDFGRFLFDAALALDPKRHKNLQLKITHNLALTDASASAAYLEVWADCFDEKAVSPMGFLVAKEIYNYTCAAANSYQYIDLPTDALLRKLLIRGFYSGTAPWDSLIEARLSEDNDKRIPFDMDLEDWSRFRKGIDPPIEETFVGVSDTTARTFYVTPTDYYASVLANSIQALTSTPGFSSYAPGGKFTVTANAYSTLWGKAFGWLPNHCFQLPFGDQKDTNDWYDVTKLGSLRLRLKAGTNGTNGTGQVITEQLKKY